MSNFSIEPGWMLLAEFCAKHNQKVATIHKRVADGAWPRGVIYSCPDGDKSYVHEARALEWEAGKVALFSKRKETV